MLWAMEGCVLVSALGCDTAKERAIALGVAAALALAIAVLLRFVTGLIGLEGNLYRDGFIFALAFSAFSFFVFRKQLGTKPENVFLCCVLTFTCFSSISYSVNEVSWDLDSHYRFMLEWSDLDRTEELSNADVAIIIRTESVVNTSIEAIDDRIEELDALASERADNAQVVHGSWRDLYKRISSLPASFIYFVLTCLGMSFSVKFVAARLIYAIVYALVLYVGMRRLKSGKMIFAAVALYPTMLFIASTYSYDYWVNAFVMTGLAYLVGTLQRPGEKVTLREAVLMVGAFVIGLGPKAIYFPMILLCLLVPKSKFASARQSRFFRAAVLGATLFVLASFAVPYFLVSGPGIGDTRGGSGVNSTEQIKFILANPVEYAGICLSFLGQYLSLLESQGYIIYYAYLGFCSPVIWMAILLLTAFVTVTDKSSCDKTVNAWRQRVLVVVVSFVTLVLVATSLYVSFTSVASPTVAGCQPRYILPLLFAFLVFIGPRAWRWSIAERWLPVYNGLIVASMVAFNYVGLWQVYIGLLH